MIYHHLDGLRTRVLPTPHVTDSWDFHEYTLAADGVMVDGARYTLTGREANDKLAELIVLDAIRFGAKYHPSAPR